MTISTEVLWAIIFVALAFDFLNGLHDAANSIATIVSTRVLRPQYAVAWAAFFNFIAFLFFGLSVAQIEAILKHLSPDMGREDWIRVGMALHHECEGDDTGFDQWDEWSSDGATYPRSEEHTSELQSH